MGRDQRTDSLDKSGPGTLVLNNGEQLSGILNVNGGTLNLGSNATLPNGIAISVANGATLNVIGSIAGNPITNSGTVNFPASASAGMHLLVVSNLTITAGETTVASPAVSYCQKSWMKSEPQAASFSPSLKIAPAITAGSNVLPLSFRQWF